MNHGSHYHSTPSQSLCVLYEYPVAYYAKQHLTVAQIEHKHDREVPTWINKNPIALRPNIGKSNTDLLYTQTRRDSTCLQPTDFEKEYRLVVLSHIKPTGSHFRVDGDGIVVKRTMFVEERKALEFRSKFLGHRPLLVVRIRKGKTK